MRCGVRVASGVGAPHGLGPSDRAGGLADCGRLGRGAELPPGEPRMLLHFPTDVDGHFAFN